MHTPKTEYVSPMLIGDNPVTLTALTAVNKLSIKATFTPGLYTPGRFNKTKDDAIAKK